MYPHKNDLINNFTYIFGEKFLEKVRQKDDKNIPKNEGFVTSPHGIPH